MEENTVLIMNVLRGGVLMVPVARPGGAVMSVIRRGAAK